MEVARDIGELKSLLPGTGRVNDNRFVPKEAWEFALAELINAPTPQRAQPGKGTGQRVTRQDSDAFRLQNGEKLLDRQCKTCISTVCKGC